MLFNFSVKVHHFFTQHIVSLTCLTNYGTTKNTDDEKISPT